MEAEQRASKAKSHLTKGGNGFYNFSEYHSAPPDSSWPRLRSETDGLIEVCGIKIPHKSKKQGPGAKKDIVCRNFFAIMGKKRRMLLIKIPFGPEKGAVGGAMEEPRFLRGVRGLGRDDKSRAKKWLDRLRGTRVEILAQFLPWTEPKRFGGAVNARGFQENIGFY